MSCPLPPPAFARGVRRTDAPARAHYGRVFDVASCPWDENLFATAGEDETARVWRDESGAGNGGRVVPHGVCRGHKDEVTRVAWHPTMRVLASGSADGGVAVWKVAQPGFGEAANAHDPQETSVARVDVLGPHAGEVYGLAFIGDTSGGSPVLATAAGTDLRLWDLETVTELVCVAPVKHDLSGSDTAVNKTKNNPPNRWEPGYLFSLSSDSGKRNLLASGCSDGTVKLFGCDGGGSTASAVASIPNHPNALAAATCFLPGGDLLASAGSDKTVVITDVRMSHRCVRKVHTPVVVMGLCAVPSGDDGGGWLAMVGSDGVVRCTPGEGGGKSAALRQFGDDEKNKTPVPLLCVASNKDGTAIFAAGSTHAAVASPTKPTGGGPFSLGSIKGQGTKKPEPAEIFIWQAR